jgi:hypothetical protein
MKLVIHTLTALAALPLAPAAGEGRLVVDLEERLRPEVRNNNRDFNDRSNDFSDDSWLLSRFRLGVALKPTRWLKLYAQGQDVHEWDTDRAKIPGVGGADGNDEFDLRQASVEFADYLHFPLGLQVGRQVLDYGDLRILADPKFSQFGRTFDAVRLRWQQPKWWLDAFAARPVQIKTGVLNDSDAADQLFGLYFSHDWLPFQTTEFYLLHRDKADHQPDLSPANGLDARGASNGPAARHTALGTRWKSKPGQLAGWDYTTELVYEFGALWVSDRTSARQELRAFAAHVMAGYTFEHAAWRPRLGLEYDYASGDRNPDDGRSQSFQNMFPSNHEKYAYMDVFDWRNLHDLRVQLTAKPAKTLDLDLDYHAFWLADTHDYWWRGSGLSPLRTRTPDGRDVRRIGASSFAGQEIDIVLKWAPTAWLKVEAGYSHFFAGDYLRDTGPHDDADFAYVMTPVKF